MSHICAHFIQRTRTNLTLEFLRKQSRIGRYVPLLRKYFSIFLNWHTEAAAIDNVECITSTLTLTFLHFLAAIDLDFFLSDSRGAVYLEV
jgi:hypothetical protein